MWLVTIDQSHSKVFEAPHISSHELVHGIRTHRHACCSVRHSTVLNRTIPSRRGRGRGRSGGRRRLGVDVCGGGKEARAGQHGAAGAHDQSLPVESSWLKPGMSEHKANSV